MKRLIATSLVLTACTAAWAEDKPQPTADKLANINNYLTDITAGAVSATGLIDAKDMTITPIETAQDLVVAITPLASGGGSGKSFGLAITPARTTLLPLSGSEYLKPGAWWARLWGNLTLSYAQNEAEHGGQTYKKSAFSIDTVYFFTLSDDPVFKANQAFVFCARKPSDFATDLAKLHQKLANGDITESELKAEEAKIGDARAVFLDSCMDDKIAKSYAANAARFAPWNSARASFSYGEGRIRPVAGGTSYSLGKAFTLNAQHALGTDNGVLQVSLRHARDAVDPETLVGTPSTRSSRLAALRFTYGDQGAESPLRVLAEVSSARSSDAGVYRQAFMYAVGADKRLAKGSWLEFRLGRNRSTVDGKEQTTALMSLNLAPTLMDFKK